MEVDSGSVCEWLELRSEESPEAIRERTIVELYLNGGITLDRAAEFLGVSREEFESWAEFARTTRQT